jgi:hypothetical protein
MVDPVSRNGGNAARRAGVNQCRATDSLVEQSPEGDGAKARSETARQRGVTERRGRTERREGTGRGDAGRLPARGTLRRVARRGKGIALGSVPRPVAAGSPAATWGSGAANRPEGCRGDTVGTGWGGAPGERRPHPGEGAASRGPRVSGLRSGRAVVRGRQRAGRWQHRPASQRVEHGSGEERGPETRRTPWLAAGCNKPARRCAEKTVEAGRNGRDGTSPGGGSPGPMAEDLARDSAGSGRASLVLTEGRSLDNPKRGVRPGAGPAGKVPRGAGSAGQAIREDSSVSSSPKERTRPRPTSRRLAALAWQAGMKPRSSRGEARAARGRAGRASHPHSGLTATKASRHLYDGSRSPVG